MALRMGRRLRFEEELEPDFERYGGRAGRLPEPQPLPDPVLMPEPAPVSAPMPQPLPQPEPYAAYGGAPNDQYREMQVDELRPFTHEVRDIIALAADPSWMGGGSPELASLFDPYQGDPNFDDQRPILNYDRLNALFRDKGYQIQSAPGQSPNQYDYSVRDQAGNAVGNTWQPNIDDTAFWNGALLAAAVTGANVYGAGAGAGATGSSLAENVALMEANGLTAAEIGAATGGQAAGFTAADVAAMGAADVGAGGLLAETAAAPQLTPAAMESLIGTPGYGANAAAEVIAGAGNSGANALMGFDSIANPGLWDGTAQLANTPGTQTIEIVGSKPAAPGLLEAVAPAAAAPLLQPAQPIQPEPPPYSNEGLNYQTPELTQGPGGSPINAGPPSVPNLTPPTTPPYSNEGNNYPTPESTQGPGGSPVNSSPPPGMGQQLYDWLKANPKIGKGLFMGGTSLLSAADGGGGGGGQAPAPSGPPVQWTSGLQMGIQPAAQPQVQRVLPPELQRKPSGLSMGAARFFGG